MTFWETFGYTIGELDLSVLLVYDSGNTQIVSTGAGYGKDIDGRLTSGTYPTDSQGETFGYTNRRD